MGIEEKIYFRVEEPERIDDMLRSHRHFRLFDEQNKLYYFSSDDSWKPPDWPDASIAIEADGIYFNDSLRADISQLRTDIKNIAHRYCDNCEFEEL